MHSGSTVCRVLCSVCRNLPSSQLGTERPCYPHLHTGKWDSRKSKCFTQSYAVIKWWAQDLNWTLEWSRNLVYSCCVWLLSPLLASFAGVVEALLMSRLGAFVHNKEPSQICDGHSSSWGRLPPFVMAALPAWVDRLPLSPAFLCLYSPYPHPPTLASRIATDHTQAFCQKCDEEIA